MSAHRIVVIRCNGKPGCGAETSTPFGSSRAADVRAFRKADGCTSAPAAGTSAPTAGPPATADTPEAARQPRRPRTTATPAATSTDTTATTTAGDTGPPESTASPTVLTPALMIRIPAPYNPAARHHGRPTHPDPREHTVARVEPNPPSPYATADPQYRHILPIPLFFPTPEPGTLAVTGCRELAVAPATLADATPDGTFPDGLCPTCVTAMTTGVEPDPRPTHECTDCGLLTEHDGLCAVCRIDKHDADRAVLGQDGGQQCGCRDSSRPGLVHRPGLPCYLTDTE